MNWVKVLHGVAAGAAILGVLTFFGAWIAGDQGTFLGLSEAHLVEDTKMLFLASVAFGVATIIHLQTKNK